MIVNKNILMEDEYNDIVMVQTDEAVNSLSFIEEVEGKFVRFIDHLNEVIDSDEELQKCTNYGEDIYRTDRDSILKEIGIKKLMWNTPKGNIFKFYKINEISRVINSIENDPNKIIYRVNIDPSLIKEDEFRNVIVSVINNLALESDYVDPFEDFEEDFEVDPFEDFESDVNGNIYKCCLKNVADFRIDMIITFISNDKYFDCTIDIVVDCTR